MDEKMGEQISQLIDEHLAKYRELVKKRIALEKRLESAQTEKDSVKESIFKKVCKEYRQQLSVLAEEIKPIENEVEKIRHMIAVETNKIDEEARSLTDEIEELDFRHRVNEFDAQELAEKQRPIRERHDEMIRTQSELKRQLLLLDADNQIEEESVEPPSQPAAEKPSKKKPSQAEVAAAPAAMNTPKHDADEQLVDPSEWMEEFTEERSAKPAGRRRTDGTPVSQNASADSDPLSRLADPTNDTAAKPDKAKKQSAGVATKSPPKTFPVLIIVRGAGSGRKIPLMPITMTIGREHDNNIELKDEEVARYHARIAHENGEYVLQDLESSSGTWVNEERIGKPVNLEHNDRIRVGATELMIDFE